MLVIDVLCCVKDQERYRMRNYQRVVISPSQSPVMIFLKTLKISFISGKSPCKGLIVFSVAFLADFLEKLVTFS